MFSLNGHAIAATSVDGGRFPTLRFADAPEAQEKHFTGGISFLQREFLRWGDCFVIGIGPEIALYRCIPGVRRFEDQEVEPWRLVKQGVLHADDWDHGDVTAVKFVRETLYAAFDGPKHPLYQWSMPDKDQRHVSELIGACMQPGCGRSFGLLGELYAFHTDRRTAASLRRLWWCILRLACAACRVLRLAILR